MVGFDLFLPKIKLDFCGVGSALCGIKIPENIEGPPGSKKFHDKMIS